MIKKVLLIVNRTARKAKNVIVPEVKAFFEKNNVSLDVAYWRKRGDAIIASKEAAGRYDVVIAAGGDGTINEAINGLAGSKTRLGIIPAGTGNVFAIELNIPRDVKKACEIIFRGKTRKVDLGKANNRYFLLWTGIGIDAHAIKAVHQSLFWKQLLGAFAFFFLGLKSYFYYQSRKLYIYQNQNLVETGYFVVAGNVKHYAGSFRLLPFADLEDGNLDVLVFKKRGLTNYLRYFFGIYTGSHIGYDDVVYFKTKRISVVSKRPMLVHVDGDVVDVTPVSIVVLPKYLEVIVP